MFRKVLQMYGNNGGCSSISGRKQVWYNYCLIQRPYHLSSSTLRWRKETSVSSQVLERTDHFKSSQPQSQQYLPYKTPSSSSDQQQHHHERPPPPDSQVIIFQKQIKHVSSSSELLQLIESQAQAPSSSASSGPGSPGSLLDHPSIIESALQTLFYLAKHEKCSDSVKHDLLNSVAMQRLCKTLRYQSRWMEVGNLLTAVKVLVFLNAPASNLTLQLLLRLLSKQVNAMSLQEISYLHFLLDKTPESPLVAGLKLALPVIFEAQLPIQLDKTHGQGLVDNLCYAVGYGVQVGTTQILINALLDKAGSEEGLTPKQANLVLLTLTALRKSSSYNNVNELMSACFSRVTGSLESFTTDEISTTLGKLAKRVHNGSRGSAVDAYYNEDFVNGVCNVMVKRKSKEQDKLSALYMAKHISLMRHINIDYLDYITEIVTSDPCLLLNSDILFIAIVRTLSKANYKPSKWPILQPILLEHPALTKDLKTQGITVAADLLTLNICPSTLISKLFGVDNYTALDSFVLKSSPYLLMLVYDAVKYLQPSAGAGGGGYDGPLPPISMVQKWKNILLSSSKLYPLKGSLEAGFGGANYVISGIFHEGIHIDHGIIMRKGGFPVAIKNVADGGGPKLLSDLELPPDSVVVMLKAFLQESYANNTARLRGTNALELKLIESFGHPVIPIDVERWKELQDYEKIPFLMHLVKDKLDKCWVNNNTNNSSYY